MSGSFNPEGWVRAQGADMRKHVTMLLLNCSADIGRQVLARLVWEVVDLGGEVYGPTVAVDMLATAGAGLEIDHAPPIEIDDGPDPLVQVIEGLTTVAEQARVSAAKSGERIEEVAAAALQIAQLVEGAMVVPTRIEHAPRTWRDHVVAFCRRAQFWPLFFVAGFIAASVIYA